MTNRALEARLQNAAKAARLRRLERSRSYLQHRFNRLQLIGAYHETPATVRALCIAGFCVSQGGEVNPGAIEAQLRHSDTADDSLTTVANVHPLDPDDLGSTVTQPPKQLDLLHVGSQKPRRRRP
jgi:hypothetical protein